MIQRWLTREFREYPVTSSICLSWIIVFAAMTCNQLASGAPLPADRWLLWGFGGGEPFGDLSLNDLARGQVWRIVTCNFVHYSLVHVVLNLLAMYQLGGLLESWYGSYQLLFVFGLTGGGGNLLSASIRWWLRSSREVHSAGGSTAIMGLIGLFAVAGWLSKDAEGRRLSRLMLIFIAATAELGRRWPQYIDNWGHGCGLLVGLVIGLAHRRLEAAVGKPSAWGAGVLTVLVMIGSGAAQFVAARRDAPARLERSLVHRSNYLAQGTRELKLLHREDCPKVYKIRALQWLDGLEQILDRAARAEIRALRPLIQAAESRPLNEDERHDLDRRLSLLLASMRRTYEADRHELRRSQARR
jgi:membrane associated rhomboid family serine protease